MKIPVKLTIADKSYDLWAYSTDEEAIMREAGKLINEQIRYRMANKKGDLNLEEILSMICIDAMVSRLKGDQDLDTIQSEVFKNLDTLQNHFGLSSKT